MACRSITPLSPQTPSADWPHRCSSAWRSFVSTWQARLLVVVLLGMLGLLGVLCGASAIAQEVFELEEQTVRAAVERVAPSVVRIETVGGLEHLDDVLLGEGPTTGLIVGSDGWIVSSTFNFLRQPSSILVTIPGGQRLPARIVARDHSRKLVLLHVETDKPLPVPEPIPRSEVVVGQTAIAVGRTFNPEQPNVSTGIISARERIWGKAIQTDAKISPSNYGGPLCDLRGRVYGILVPLSPNSQHELAGAEWYDGGIGFAVPLADVLQRLERMKKGQDLHPGLLGVTLKPGDIYSLPAELAACHPNSPVYHAGLRAGDTIVSVNGIRVERQAQLRHVLGPLYAGETIELVARRGEQQLRVSVELAEKIEPFELPFLGVLPQRGAAAEPGVAVRYVFPDSGAAKASIQAGDRIRKLGDKDAADAAALRGLLASLEPGAKVQLTVARAGKDETLEVTLGTLPNTFPPADAARPAQADQPQPAAVSALKIPEEANECAIYVPSTYRAEVPHGLIVTLPPPGEFKSEALAQEWSQAAERDGLIVVAPQARLPNMWLPTETAVVRKVIDHVLGSYTVDPDRIVVTGMGASGAMAYLTAFRLRDVVRGVVAIDAAIPLVVARPPDNDPVERLSVVVVQYTESPGSSRIQQNVELLREMKYPVVHTKLEGKRRELDEATRREVLRWVDTLDKL